MGGGVGMRQLTIYTQHFKKVVSTVTPIKLAKDSVSLFRGNLFSSIFNFFS
jgi:hypothetical protein